MEKKYEYIIYAAIGIVALLLISQMFGDSADQKKAARISDPLDIWELSRPDAAAEAIRRGLLSYSTLASIPQDAFARMGEDILKLYDAPANWYAWGDDERAAVAAIVGRNSYEEMVIFNDLFASTYGPPVAQFLLTFMDYTGWTNDAAELALIVDRVLALRPTNYPGNV